MNDGGRKKREGGRVPRWARVLGALVRLNVAFVLSRLLWRAALKRYTGASG